jgi:hypothetical protein
MPYRNTSTLASVKISLPTTMSSISSTSIRTLHLRWICTNPGGKDRRKEMHKKVINSETGDNKAGGEKGRYVKEEREVEMVVSGKREGKEGELDVWREVRIIEAAG